MKYRKKPVVIEAIEYTIENLEEVKSFVGEESLLVRMYADMPNLGDTSIVVSIQTLEGDMTVQECDMIIKGVNGEFYPCKPDIFVKTYEAVSESENTWQSRLVVETEELAKKVNMLHLFMATKEFHELLPHAKDLLYEQEEYMMKYLKTLGKRCALGNLKLYKGRHYDGRPI